MFDFLRPFIYKITYISGNYIIFLNLLLSSFAKLDNRFLNFIGRIYMRPGLR